MKGTIEVSFYDKDGKDIDGLSLSLPFPRHQEIIKQSPEHIRRKAISECGLEADNITNVAIIDVVIIPVPILARYHRKIDDCWNELTRTETP